MERSFALGCAFFSVIFLSACSPAQSQPEQVKDQWIVKYRSESSLLSAKAGSLSAVEESTDLAPLTEVVNFSRDEDPETRVQQLRESELVEYIEPDYIAHAERLPFENPNDPDFSRQWAHAVVKSEEAWVIVEGSPSVVVGVLDSGLDYTHTDLARNVWVNADEIPGNGIDDDHNGYIDDVRGWDFVNNDNIPLSDDIPVYHGMHVAGTIAAAKDNRRGGIGHAPGVKVMPLKFLAGDGNGAISGAIRAIDYAIAKGVKILNNSWGFYGNSMALRDAVNRARRAGVLFVAAAGNGDEDTVGDNNDLFPHYPSNIELPNVISVAATGRDDRLGRFSNYGRASVDLAAPGVGIFSLANSQRYQYLSGTSMATPVVSAVVALMWSVRPDLSATQIKAALLGSVDRNLNLRGKMVSGGRVNAAEAVMAAIRVPRLEGSHHVPGPLY